MKKMGKFKNESGIVDAPIGRHPVDRKKMAVINDGTAREAVTHYEVLERFSGVTHLALRLETGRTHQIRAHLYSVGHPLLGDYKYGNKKWNDIYKKKYKIEDQMLHAYELQLPNMKTPLDNLSKKKIQAKVPEVFWKMIKETAWVHGIQEALEVLH